MAIDYALELACPEPADRVARVLPQTRLPSGLLVMAGERSPLPFPDPVEEQFGFTPTVHVLFRLDMLEDGARQRRDMIRLATTILDRFDGPALLTFAGEITWLLRRNGKLMISDRDDFWPPLPPLPPPPPPRTHTPPQPVNALSKSAVTTRR
ncbi:SitI3 family protein [Actinomadura rugatobispora]|uniref:SitI3 family protein n=1 Tax=Actinomadura rugatobispora TaxID=1994 RepID=A0ABW0ZUQ7_9ACTN|nr:hypothetical protein GCM10010200_023870 [Actinomadura rugatobispora]